MANQLYDNYKETLLGAGNHGPTDVVNDTINMVLIDNADDTGVAATDQDLADIAAGARVAVATLGTKTTTDGAFGSANVTFTSVTGDSVEEADIYDHTGGGTDATRPLMARYDISPAVTPTGGNIIGTAPTSWFSF